MNTVTQKNSQIENTLLKEEFQQELTQNSPKELQKELQKKIIGIYNYVKDNLYLCRPDISFHNQQFNSTLLFNILTGLVNGKQMIYGEYGLGKTTSSENIISILYNYPIELVLAASLKGNSELTEEKMIGRPNLGLLNRGEEKVVWSDFVLLEPKIVDEINRISPSKQNVLLEGLDRGSWKYLNEMLSNDSIAIYATGNYKDSGNNEVIPPLLDRFNIAVESKHPGINNLRYKRFKGSENMLSDKILSMKMMEYLKTRDIKNLNILRDEHKINIEKIIGLSLLEQSELKSIRKNFDEMPLSTDAYLFYDLFTAEMSSCQVFGQKRSNEECVTGCHFKNYMCGKVSNCLSIRTDSSIKNYAAAFAWLTGSEIVTPEHLATIMPYAIWHKTRFKRDYIEEFVTEQREDPLMLHIAKKSVDKIKKRFSKTRNDQLVMCQYIKNNDWANAKEMAQRNDNPVFREYLKM